MNENHISDYLPAYALDCLDPDEKEMVASHLAGCEICQAELRTYLSVVGQLPLAAPEHNPPADLKQKIMDQARRPAQQAQQAKPVQPAQPAGLRGWLDSVFQPFSRPVWGAVSLLLILLLAAGNIMQYQQVQHLRSIAMPQFSMVRLSGTQVAPSASGMLVISSDGDFGTLVVDGMPPLASGQQYTLWLMQNGKRTSGGTFMVLQDGYGALVVKSPQNLSLYDHFGVTIEPLSGGNPDKPGTKVLGGSL
ncbi:MAG: anti-sigma factor [Anaerolineaceae bacterium]|nr:anti-sigma factor [Anaerolineaceae bacterium]